MYTKLIIVAFLACFASCYALSKGLGEKVECLHQARVAQGRIFEGTIRDAIEKLRQQLKTGFSGYPPMDPLDVTNYHLFYNNDLLNLDSNWTAKSQGISNFDVSELSLSLIGLNLKFTVNFPSVTGSGDYSADMTSPFISQRIFGKGTFDTGATGFTVKGKGKVGTKFSNGKMVVQIKSLSVEPSLNKFSLALTGFMNDEKLSQEISTTLSNDLPRLLKENTGKINEIITKALPYVNEFLAGNSYRMTPITC